MRKTSPRARRQVSRTLNVPSPIKGLNAKDSIAAMDPVSALTMTNFIARPYGCAVRQGYKVHQEGITGYVESLLPFNNTTVAASKLFAAAGDSIYDVTTVGGTPSAVQTGLTNALWQHTNFATLSGHYLVICNGTDAARLYNGTTWTTFSVVGVPAAVGEIAGSDPTKWIQTIVHQRRIWFVEKDSTAAHYLPIDSLGGTTAKLDFGALFPHGGHLVALETWTFDGGAGMDDYLVGISSNGDVVVYQGTDPSSSADWSMKGTFYIGAPIGRRCLIKYAGDILAITRDGIIPLSKALGADRTSTEFAISDAIQQTVNDLVASYSSLDGWEMAVFPAQNLLIVNVPQINRDENLQLVMSTLLQSWSVFTGMPAQCFAVFNDDLFFGGEDTVYQGLTGYRDNADADGTGGDVYMARAQQAFNHFQSPSVQKRFNMARITLVSASTQPQIQLSCATDYQFVDTTASLLASSLTGAAWDTAVWDASTWSGSLNTIASWQSITGIGYNASISLTVAVQGETYWVSTDWLYEPGSTIG